jgi:hypothetical protein
MHKRDCCNGAHRAVTDGWGPVPRPLRPTGFPLIARQAKTPDRNGPGLCSRKESVSGRQRREAVEFTSRLRPKTAAWHQSRTAPWPRGEITRQSRQRRLHPRIAPSKSRRPAPPQPIPFKGPAGLVAALPAGLLASRLLTAALSHAHNPKENTHADNRFPFPPQHPGHH